MADGLKSEQTFITHSPEETEQCGYQLACNLPSNSVLIFSGDLGSGKTTFIKGVAKCVTGIDTRQVNSPTFTYLNIYEGIKTLYHFDLYRLTKREDFFQMGFHEYLEKGGISCIEWVERISPMSGTHVNIKYKSENSREITIIHGSSS